jgi:hypothetical protein
LKSTKFASSDIKWAVACMQKHKVTPIKPETLVRTAKRHSTAVTPEAKPKPPAVYLFLTSHDGEYKGKTLTSISAKATPSRLEFLAFLTPVNWREFVDPNFSEEEVRKGGEEEEKEEEEELEGEVLEGEEDEEVVIKENLPIDKDGFRLHPNRVRHPDEVAGSEAAAEAETAANIEQGSTREGLRRAKRRRWNEDGS